MFSAVFNESPGIISNPDILMREGINEGVGQSFIALGLNQRGSVSE